MNKIFIVIQCVFVLFLCSCVSHEERLALVGRTYKFSDRQGHYGTISFNKDNTVNGFSGVNRFFGKYKVAGEHIMFSMMGSTKMAGHPDAMKFEDKFISVLSRTGRFYEIGSTLTLFNGEVPLMTLKLIKENEQ